jgi:subtilisin-like proprotein convertase family protein
MKNILGLTLLATAVFASTVARVSASGPGTISYGWSGSQTIPDNNASGVAYSFNISAGEPLAITNMTVDLNIAGGWNGDLYAYLSHGSGFSVLLNRIGSTSVNPGGSGVSGLNVEFSDSYLTDIHTFTGNPLTGNFAPDGRNVNPLTTVNTDPRAALLGNFNGLDPNGNWTLFFADVSPLATSTIQSWSVNIGVTVPEPGSMSILALAISLGVARRSMRQG